MNRAQNNSFLIAGTIVVAGILIAAGVIFFGGDSGSSVVPQSVDDVVFKNVSIENDHILGNPEADVFVVGYSDFECPFCKTFHGTLLSVLDSYGRDGRVAWIFRHFPLTSLHPKAPEEAHATECAAELGGNNGFWDFANKMFEITPSNNGLDLDLLPQIASDIGLDANAFEECQDSGKYRQAIKDSYNEAIASGGTGTPHNIFVTKDGNYFVASGALSAGTVTTIVDTILAGLDEGKDWETIEAELNLLAG